MQIVSIIKRPITNGIKTDDFKHFTEKLPELPDVVFLPTSSIVRKTYIFSLNSGTLSSLYTEV